MDLDTLTASRLLAIPPEQPERLFVRKDLIRTTYKLLAKRFHPDLPTGSTAAFTHLHDLHESAIKKLARGEWLTPGLLELSGSDGVLRRVHYGKDHDLGIGHAYLGPKFATFAINDDYADLSEVASRRIAGFKFPSDSAKATMHHRLPKVRTRFASKDLITTVFHKPEDLARLRDLLDHVGAPLDSRHVAWIMSEMLNFVCYLEWSGLTHNDLSMDTVFVCPKMHTVQVIGGWWYSVPVGSRMARVQTARTVSNLPRSVLTSKVAEIRTDLTLLRLLGRELLGDPGGSRLLMDKNVPAAMANWLRTAPSATARQDYHDWQDVLTASFGPRRFVKLDVDPSVIYKGEP